MSIKKAYIEVVEFLEANPNKKVSTILDEIKAMCESKTQQSASIKDKDGNVIAIFCYYHKQWELVSEVEYGNKASSSTGLNSMCKIGTSLWTKAQSTAKKENADILVKLEKEEIQISDIKHIQADIESKRLAMDTTDMPIGFASEEQVFSFINKE